MAFIYIKYFTIILCSIYTFCKITNTNISDNILHILCCAIYCLLIPLLYIVLPENARITYILLTSLTIFILMKLICSFSLQTTFNCSVISYAISYIFYTISTLLYCLLIIMLSKTPKENIFLYLSSSFLQIIFIILFFRIKRFKKGIKFLVNDTNSYLGTIICICIICSVVIMYTRNNGGDVIIPIIFILISFILLYIWWKERIRTSYLKRMATKEIEFLNNEISSLKTDNETLSALVHKDNKIIPALIMAVEEYMQNSANDNFVGEKLTAQLENLSKERKNVINSCHTIDCPVTSTESIAINALMNYMYQKAKQTGIELSLNMVFQTENSGIKDLTENVISESELCTLLADIIENAIIATTFNANNSILVNITSIDGIYAIEVFDGGAPFDSEVLIQFGRKRITTHKDFGTGIGLNAIYQIAKMHNASIVIDEKIASDATYSENNFTKKMSIVFNNRHEYLLISDSRNADLGYLSKRADLIIKS